LGWVLRLVQQRWSRPKEFRALLRRVVEHLDTMATNERLRWLELLSYLLALVYHVRDPAERPGLQETIETSVAADEHRKELSNMGRTIADELKEEGARIAEVTTRQQTLLRQLKRRFGEVPTSIVATIESTRDVQQLDRWLDQFVTAESFADIDFGDA